ncbi:MAG TPA: hypothetical protein PKD64_06095 [Pirellulaceae bacterium]|nr:hypothetical protein [Pirellulaceae bacterium]HMO91751.1 hypothetical protein [Pirellulaceae bacterium]HMP69550.1 hypothetical protein [Pirellulaceae bacterium]
MVVEDFKGFWEWLIGGVNYANGAWLTFLFICVATALVAIFVGYLVAVIRHGPFEAFYVCAKVIFQAPADILGTSPRRIFAIARLSAKEAIRRRVVLVTFIIFALALLFGGWFLGTRGEHPERVYVNFVMWGAQILVLMMSLLVSAFSLPEDIKNRTIYTIATKPVRPTEMIVGRIVGLTMVGTGLLATMAVMSLAFVWGGLNHVHELDLDNPVEASFAEVNERVTGRRPSEMAIKEAFTTKSSGHDHVVEILEDVRAADAPPPADMKSVIRVEDRGNKKVYYRVQVRNVGGHSHSAIVDPNTGEISLSGAKGFFRARVPLYADRLDFFDRDGTERVKVDVETLEVQLDDFGNPITEGFNIGETWTYRGYIDGGTSLARAQFDFSNFTPDRFADSEMIPLELTLSVFRSHKGNIERRIRVGLQFESIPEDSRAEPIYRSEVLEFESEEFRIQVKGIPRNLPGSLISPKGEEIETRFFNLFEEYAKNGRLRLVLTCLDENQYIGVARADVYFRAAEGVYWWNFFKGYFGIWLQMLVVISLTVGLSTVLNSPVTMLVTICALVFGFFSADIRELTLPNRDGGGPIESFVRLITQQNMQVKLDESVQVTIMEATDRLLLRLLEAVTYVVPDFSRLNFSDYVKFGYNIGENRIMVAAVISFAFCFGVSILAYFSLKTRELAA